jgi:hypothetical protein
VMCMFLAHVSIGRPTTAAVTYLEDPFLDRIRGP